jgi:hypothetical protein
MLQAHCLIRQTILPQHTNQSHATAAAAAAAAHGQLHGQSHNGMTPAVLASPVNTLSQAALSFMQLVLQSAAANCTLDSTCLEAYHTTQACCLKCCHSTQQAAPPAFGYDSATQPTSCTSKSE